MSSEDGPVDIPAEMFDEDDQAELAPVFMGARIEAELVRSLLDGSGIPAVLFAAGYYEEAVAAGDRVMVRRVDVPAALEVLSSAELDEGEIVEPDADDVTVMVDAASPEESVDEDGFDLDDEAFADESYEDGYGDDRTEVEVLASGSDWGPRIVGIIGLAALAAAVAVLIAQAD